MNKKWGIVLVGLIGIFLISYAKEHLYKNVANNVDHTKNQKNIVVKQKPVLLEQKQMLGVKVDSTLQIFDSNGSVYSVECFANRLFLYFPMDGCSSCVTLALEALEDSGIKTDEIVVLSNFYSLKELKIFEQSSKQRYLTMQVKEDLKELLSLSYSYPVLFVINEKFCVEKLFYCQSYVETLEYIKDMSVLNITEAE